MPRKNEHYDAWEDASRADYPAITGGYDGLEEDFYEDDADGTGRAMQPYDEMGERGLQAGPPAPMPSLVGISATVTNYGSPLLSYSRTMQRFYQGRRQVLSIGRHKCVICNERISGWAWLSPNGGHAHDGCYDRLAWTWASVYAEQQHLAARGELD